MVDPFSIIGIIVLIILALSLGRVFSVALKFLYYIMIATLILVFFFGISFEELIILLEQALLWVF
jgi:hypothetical protein